MSLPILEDLMGRLKRLLVHLGLVAAVDDVFCVGDVQGFGDVLAVR